MTITREEALAMAREAGIYQIERFDTVSGVNQIEALVAAAYQRGVEDEREACAKHFDDLVKESDIGSRVFLRDAYKAVGYSIRNRGTNNGL